MVNNSGIANPNSWLEICDNVAFVLQNKGTLDIYVIASDTTPTSATYTRARVTTAGATVTAGYVSIKAWS